MEHRIKLKHFILFPPIFLCVEGLSIILFFLKYVCVCVCVIYNRPGGRSWGDDVTASGMNRPFRDHIKWLFGRLLLGGDHAFIPDEIIDKPIVTYLSVDCQSIVAHLTTGLKRAVYPCIGGSDVL
jgi:hypothetical protein